MNGRSLTTRIVVINAVLFGAGTATLAFSPATVSQRPVTSELIVLVVGVGAMLVANTLLVRAAMRRVSASVDDLMTRGAAEEQARVAATLAAQERERSRIAQELHDGVGQSLTSSLLGLAALADRAPEPFADELRAAREDVRAGLDEVRGVARQLRPHVLEDLGLRSALTALTRDLFTSTPVRVNRGFSPGLPPVDEQTELVVFRVAQEALTNVARHAQASSVDLVLAPRGDALVLTVSDDGVGTPPGASGSGLRGMRERAQLIGATLELRGGPSGGSVVELTVPGVLS